MSAQNSVNQRALRAVRRMGASLIVVAFGLSTLVAGTQAQAAHAAGKLRIYYRSPVLVRTGELVRVPVDVACATPDGRACEASVALATTDRGGRWRSFSAGRRNQMQFDLTRPALRVAATSSGSGSVPFRLTGRAADGRLTSVPAGRGALHLYVTAKMRRIDLRSIPLEGDVRRSVVLRLPWGTGRYRAGLSPGNESATVGPSSFDVDAGGRIYLLDALQNRVAVFRRGRLVRQIPIAVTPQSDIALGEDGSAYLARQEAGRVKAEILTPSGRVLEQRDLGPGILAEIRASQDRPYVHLLPLDAWVPLDRPRGKPRAGLPMAKGRLLLQAIVGTSVRLGVARGPRVERAVELDSTHRLGELALGARDRSGSVLAVFRELAGGNDAAGRYMAVRLARDGSMARIAMPASRFTDQLASSQIRLGPDGALYQLRTFSDGMRIVRYEMGEGS